jgi:sugar phosphate isomerase/epimerase
MKIGCCLGPLATDEAKIGITILPVIAPLGFDYIELPLAQMMAVSAAQRAEIARFVKAENVSVEACNNFFPSYVRLTGNDAKPEAALEYAKGACEWAASLGAQVVVLGSAGAKNLPAGFSYAAGKAQFLDFLNNLEMVAGPLGLTVAVEPLNSNESNFITSVREGIELVQELNCQHIRLLADYYHMRMEDEDATVILKTGAVLRHVHIAAKAARALPREGDGEDYAGFIQLLRAIGYNGRISLEGMSSNIITDAVAALKVLRSFSIFTQFHC